MNNDAYIKTWNQTYLQAPDTLDRMGVINRVACAFNTCIDSVVKISGYELSDMIKQEKLSLKKLTSIKEHTLSNGADLLKAVFRCFCDGIAEEWIAKDKSFYDWMMQHFGTDRVQMGGQAGIIANTLSLTHARKIIVHSNALSDLQSEQFFDNINLLSFTKDGELKQVSRISRDENSSIHWIIEFDKGDVIEVDGKEFTCPKSNRFIATYDPPLFNFEVDENFLKYTYEHKFDYFILSGFQALSSEMGGLEHIDRAVEIIKKWKEVSPISTVHLEIASTQDLKIREAIATKLIPIVDSLGLNEREAMDILEVIGEKNLFKQCQTSADVINLFQAAMTIKNTLKPKRIQLHMFGIYIKIQDHYYPISPRASVRGMVLASVAAASKAKEGGLLYSQDILSAHGYSVSEIGINQLKNLSAFLKDDNLLWEGLTRYQGFDIMAVPTIIIDQPQSLVGMGDTISAFSLLGSR